MNVVNNFRKLAEAGAGFATSTDEIFLKILEAPLQDDGLAELLNGGENKPTYVSLELLLMASFDNARDMIERMDLQQRIDTLQALHEYQSFLYEGAGKYGHADLKREEQISAATFRAILGKIKHLEILQNWLYGIY